MTRQFTHIFFYILVVSLLWIPGFSVLANVDVSVATTSVHLQIESATLTIYNAELVVSACPVTASSTPTLNAYCAVKQTGLESDWSAYGEDLFLNSISGVASDYVTNQYWNWFSNLDYGQTSLSQHILVPGEKILITIGRLPLKISVSTTTPTVGEVLQVGAFAFGFDSSWNGVWSGFASSSIKIGNSLFPTNGSGLYETIIGTSTSFSVLAQANNYLDSNTINILPQVTMIDLATSTATSTIPELAVETSSGGSSDTREIQKRFDVEKALDFLISRQEEDGSFGSSLYTDWAAFALVAGGRGAVKNKLKGYMKEADFSLSSATDYERHAMALMALGINPYTGTAVNYIQKIVEEFDGGQVGDKDLINDDIFALFPLLKAGYNTDDQIIKSIIATIISAQDSDGSWNGSIDLTAAGIQALNLVKDLPGVKEAQEGARNYLLEQQEEDGGFGSSFATSWVLQAISSLGEENSAWSKGGNTPEDYLAERQQADGGVETVDKSDSTRLWATAYAVTAVLHRSWSSLLMTFSKPTLDSGDLDTEEMTGTTTVAVNLLPELTSLELGTSSPLILPPAVEFTPLITPIKKVEVKGEEGLPPVKKSPLVLSAAIGQTSFSPKSSSIVIIILLLLGLSAGIYFSKIKKS
jgi:hypothetical protein